MSTANIPYIDPNVEHVGISKLRKLTASTLRDIDKTLVIQYNHKPLAVLLTYEQFLIMQTKMQSIVETLEVLGDSEEAEALGAGLEDVSEGRTRSLSEIRRSLKKARQEK